jgi:hypothetical protein
MLSAILPGLRQVRAPLVAGALILGSLYILLQPLYESSLADDQRKDGLAALDAQLGSGGWAVVISITAYLVGATFVGLRNTIVSRSAKRQGGSVNVL